MTFRNLLGAVLVVLSFICYMTTNTSQSSENTGTTQDNIDKIFEGKTIRVAIVDDATMPKSIVFVFTDGTKAQIKTSKFPFTIVGQ